MEKSKSAFVMCCRDAKLDPEAVKWNPYNKVIQCHVCGHVYVPNNYSASDVKVLENAYKLDQVKSHLLLRMADLKKTKESDLLEEVMKVWRVVSVIEDEDESEPERERQE